MWMVVGLGNPGAKYARNRHNVGFRVVDELVRRHGLSDCKGGKFGGDTTSGVVTTPRGRQKALLIKPMEYMNLSGFAVQRAARFHDVAIDEIVVVHDEIDLDFGTVRLKRGGGHGGHNGLRSIAEQLGGADFLRVRCGVGKPGPRAGAADGGAASARAAGNVAAASGDKNVAGWVLADFPAAQATEVDAMVGRAADGVEAVLGLGIAAAMNQFNGKASA
ncbi:MAG: aminoacyl-tRNA hydrolase [Kofleriaceae bacterium]|nr:aminoacyl-tRNA hydrolase [Myxococcales bacterium]MCB9565012.1 aminoacyl-tRNA hydrolase [Kofleriaceae bacterium]MCB9575075.1 aminoacyl-tRNA hydrolase [Kofleriaceae bacterium]